MQQYKVAGYVRLSKEDKTDDNKLSIFLLIPSFAKPNEEIISLIEDEILSKVSLVLFDINFISSYLSTTVSQNFLSNSVEMSSISFDISKQNFEYSSASFCNSGLLANSFCLFLR